ncbi:MAG: zinc-binding dehydrogenase, partial [Acidimicrobiales bacterium]
LVVDDAVDVVLECSGAATAMEAGLAQLERGGTLVLVGAGMEPPRFDPNRILLNELVVTGAYEYDADGFDRALELLASGALPVDRLLEPDDVPLDETLDAMRRLAAGALPGKVLIAP